MPNVLPLPTMFVHRFVMLASSAGLSVARKNGVSATASVPAAAPACTVVPKANDPPAVGNATRRLVLKIPAGPVRSVQLAPPFVETLVEMPVWTEAIVTLET